MGEKRQAYVTILLRKKGKKEPKKIIRAKVELFKATDFELPFLVSKAQQRFKYRLRVDGVWWPKGERKFFTRTQIKEYFWRGLNL